MRALVISCDYSKVPQCRLHGCINDGNNIVNRLQKIDPSAVQLLSLQYRMHPEISSFPSSYFYGGKLMDGPNVSHENTRPWHKTHGGMLGPCRFFDIPGQEQLRTFASGRQGNSMMNELEAKITSSLVALLSNSSPEYKVNFFCANNALQILSLSELTLEFSKPLR